MRKIIGLMLLIAVNFFMTGCSNTPVFQSQLCKQEVRAPVIDNETLIQFAKLHMNLMPQGSTLVIVLPTDYFFKQVDSPALKPEQYPNLDQLVTLLKKYGPAKIKIAGYTDNVINRSQNKLNAEQQARALLTYLWVKGIPADQLYAVGYGDQAEVADNATVRGSAFNRRIEITVKAACL